MQIPERMCTKHCYLRKYSTSACCMQHKIDHVISEQVSFAFAPEVATMVASALVKIQRNLFKHELHRHGSRSRSSQTDAMKAASRSRSFKKSATRYPQHQLLYCKKDSIMSMYYERYSLQKGMEPAALSYCLSVTCCSFLTKFIGTGMLSVMCNSRLIGRIHADQFISSARNRKSIELDLVSHMCARATLHVLLMLLHLDVLT
jgi:hypothetical protein